MKTSSTRAPGLRLVLLASPFVMVLLADMPIASAAPGGAEREAAPPAGGEMPFDRQGMWIVDGAIGDTTWGSLLNFDPARPRWAGRRAKRGSGGGAAASRALPPRRPLSASLPAKADEIDPGPAP